MQVRKLCNGLQLHNNQSFKDKVEPLSLDHRAFVHDIQLNLPLCSQASSAKFMHESLFVDRLKQTRSKLTMNLDRSTN